MNLSDTIVAAIRTAVPLGVGWLLAQLALLGLTLPADVEPQLAGALTALAAAAYWAAATALSKRWPALAWLLGSAKEPVYVAPTEVAVIEPRAGESRAAYRARQADAPQHD